ncbi:hypothetical protein ILYODFUR_028077 [Ilyodon furcidens]|uniref:Uncharacterized protein n=1 Tax=Ilyodon furcidens TaxID=33524 RepID=A0ABV0SSY9_9TELE
MSSIFVLPLFSDGPKINPVQPVGHPIGKWKQGNLQCFHPKPLECFLPCQSPVFGTDHGSVNPSQNLKRTRELYPGTVTSASLNMIYSDPEEVRLQCECVLFPPYCMI